MRKAEVVTGATGRVVTVPKGGRVLVFSPESMLARRRKRSAMTPEQKARRKLAVSRWRKQRAEEERAQRAAARLLARVPKILAEARRREQAIEKSLRRIEKLLAKKAPS